MERMQLRHTNDDGETVAKPDHDLGVAAGC